MGHRKAPKELAKMLAYILGRRPGEFGLVPDREGFVKIKELLKVFSEEQGWGYVRRSHLEEVRLTLTPPLIEIRDNLVRAENRTHLSASRTVAELPKLLYTCVRQKAYPFVAAKGVMKSDGDVVLSADLETARRLGRRIDRSPILLTVQVKKTLAQRVRYFTSGDGLYTAASIPAGCFTGPPLPKEKPDPAAPPDLVPTAPKKPGSYTIELKSDGRVDSAPGKSGKNTPPWKKKPKRDKQRHEKPPWRR